MNPLHHSSVRSSRSGSILIVTLWTLMFLGALAVVVATYVETGIRVAERAKRRTGGYYLARAGIEAAMVELVADTNDWDALDESWSRGEEIFRDVVLEPGVYALFHEQVSDEGVVTNFGLVDEERKVNLNLAHEALLRALLESAGGMDSGVAEQITTAIVEWREVDDELTDEAETGYTRNRNLSQPSAGPGGGFDAVQELRLVQGVDDGLFSRLEPYLTVYGSGKVNINTAESMVLEALALARGGRNVPRLCESLAAKIVAHRESEGGFEERTPASILRGLRESGDLSPQESALLSGMLRSATLQSTCFGGMAVGKLAERDDWDSKIAFVIDKGKQEIVSWRLID